MSAADPVRAMFAAFASHGADGALRHFADDAVLVVGPETSAEPDTYEGAEGAERYFGGFEGALDEVAFEIVAVIDDGAETLICDVRLSGVGSATRIPVEQRVRMRFEVGADGLIRRVVALGPTPG